MIKSIKIIFLLLIFCSFLWADILDINLGNGKTTHLYYEVKGEGQPFIIYNTSTQGYFEAIFETRPGYKRIYIDPPGIGESGSDDWIMNADDCLQVVLEAIDRLVKKQKFLVAGFSYFGYQARGIALKRKESIKGMILICPVIIPEFIDRNRTIFELSYIDSSFINNLDKDDKETVSSLVIQNRLSFETVKKYSRNEVKMNAEFWQKIKTNNYAFSFDPDEKISSFNKPVLVFVGLQDNIVGFKDAVKLFDNYHRLSFVALDYASHDLPFEQNIIFSNHVSHWLDQLKFNSK